MRSKIILFIIGCAALAFVWWVLLPLLVGTIHTIVMVGVILLAIVWVLWLGGVIPS